MSPIAGLSEHRRLPRIGKIRLGIKVPNAKDDGEHAKAVDYFVLPENLKPFFPEEKLTQIPIMIPVEDDEVWCSQYYKCYSSYRGCTCRGDGVTASRMIDTATGDKAGRGTKDIVWKRDFTCSGRQCPDYISGDCKEVMNLQFIMPDIPGLGVWQIDTSSVNSIRNINNAAAMIRAVYKRISFIPLLLTLEPADTVTKDGKKKKIYVLNLRTNGTMKELMQLASQPVTELLLPAPIDDEPPFDGYPDLDQQHLQSEAQVQDTAAPPIQNTGTPLAAAVPPAESPKKAARQRKPVVKDEADDTPPLTDADFFQSNEGDDAGEPVQAKKPVTYSGKCPVCAGPISTQDDKDSTCPQCQVIIHWSLGRPAAEPIKKAAEDSGKPAEGSDTWLLLAIVKLKVSNESVIQLLTSRYHIPVEKLNHDLLGDNFKLLAKNQREDMTKILKDKLSANNITV
ncbi:MAG: hypothetical protein PHU23_03180 [Dehalococcoidales bacterium]|nr:hypothetical protein [Dehalococcoidales bacterium]